MNNPCLLWTHNVNKLCGHNEKFLNVTSVGTYSCHWTSDGSYRSGRTPRVFITISKPSTRQNPESFNVPTAKYTVLRSIFVLYVTCLTSCPECACANADHACTGSYVIMVDTILVCIQQDATLHSLFYLETALHVSGGTTTHHQQRRQL